MSSTNYYRYSIQAYIERLIRNKRTIETLDAKKYPNLDKALSLYGNSLRNKLLELLEIFSNYRMKPSYHKIRGYEMACSLDYLVSQFGGGKEAWSKALLKLCTLGLLEQFRPRGQGHNDFLNTPAQTYSANRTNKNKRRPVTWYHVPEYSESLLMSAEKKAIITNKYKGGLDKDGIRYELGVSEANRICDTGYPKSERRKEAEDAILRAINKRIESKGYTTKEEVLSDAQIDTNQPIKLLKNTWRSYRHYLSDNYGIQYGAPNKNQRDMYQLEDDKWIITKQ